MVVPITVGGSENNNSQISGLCKLAYEPTEYVVKSTDSSFLWYHFIPTITYPNKFSVISPSYCAPKALNLQINTKKGVTYDVKGNRVFYIKDTLFTFHGRRVLCDDKGNPIVTLYKKNVTLHGQCKVFRGNTSELLFSVKRSSIIPSGNMLRLDVFLGNKRKGSMCDFRVIVRGSKNSCTIYAGESPTIVAKMENNGGFKVLVYPNVDYTFIVALLMIIDDIKDYDVLVNASVSSILTVATGGILPILTLFEGENLEEETLDGENLEEEYLQEGENNSGGENLDGENNPKGENLDGENLEVENNFEAET
ncbi:protein LURP-one-related 15-like [Glycine max]|uniref:protein LURP-one-related 15-like n=1 Tax=Glycine max TaxID=3847 RepID=UPI001B3564FC|nr:protein LURP-one-related 15-like [Glycine max]